MYLLIDANGLCSVTDDDQAVIDFLAKDEAHRAYAFMGWQVELVDDDTAGAKPVEPKPDPETQPTKKPAEDPGPVPEIPADLKEVFGESTQPEG